MNCSFCGTALPEGTVHCPSCGSSTARVQEPGQITPRIATPFSLQRSDKRQTTSVFTPLQLPSSKLSSYKPTSTSLVPTPPVVNPIGPNSGSMPGIAPGSKLSHYNQASPQPSKLSDYKQPSVQRRKLSDYKTGAKPGIEPGSAPNYDALASMPTAPAPFHTGTSSPPISPSYPPSMASAYPQTANAGNITNGANLALPSSFAPTREAYTPNPVLQIADPPLPKRSKPQGLLMGGIAVILLVACIGAASFFFLQRTNSAKQEVNATKVVPTLVPTVAPVHGPSGNTSVPAVSALFSEPQTAAAIDESNKARQITSTFPSGKTVFVTFSLHSKDQKGYLWARWYKGKQLFHEVSIAHDPSKTNDYFSIVYDASTPDGSVELYWSTTPNFSDAKLARVVHFTVTNNN